MEIIIQLNTAIITEEQRITEDRMEADGIVMLNAVAGIGTAATGMVIIMVQAITRTTVPGLPAGCRFSRFRSSRSRFRACEPSYLREPLNGERITKH